MLCKKSEKAILIQFWEDFFMDKAIIIGASSGIGRELAKILSKAKYDIGLVARRN